MSNDVVIRSGKTLRVGEVDWLIVDDGIAPVMPTLFVEGRHWNGVIYLSVAQSIIDADNPPEAHVCARLRFDVGFAQLMRDQLNQLVEMALAPADKSQAN